MNTRTAIELMNAVSFGSGDASFEADLNGFAIDSRNVRAGDLFFALSPTDYKRHSFTATVFVEGHDFVPQAFAQGASAAVVLRERIETDERLHEYKSKLLIVEDVIDALQRLARRVIDRWNKPVVAITGSAGKTTTKNMSAHLLASSGRRVLASMKNFNNELGVPLSILQMESNGARPEDYDLAILEMGMSLPGEIARLCRIAPPHIGVELLVSPVHLEFFGTIERIAEGKRALVEALRPEGTAILNADDERVIGMRECHKGRTLTFGVENRADVTATEIEMQSLTAMTFRLHTPHGTAHCELSVPGRHNLMNALAAAAVATCFEIAPERIADALRTVAASEMRGEVLRFREGFTVIDDSYNSNPRSLVSMARTLAEGGREAKRRIVVAGEMLELGEDTAALHRGVGSDIGKMQIDLLWGVRGHASELLEGAHEAGMTPERTRFFESAEAAAITLTEEARAGDMILVKGSRGVRTDKVIALLRERFGREMMNDEL